MRNRLRFALLLMGFTSLVVQVLLIREFLVCFYGNELTIGLILGNWIILEAVGSSIFSKPSQKSKRPVLSYCLLQCLIAIYLPCAIYLVRTVKDFLPVTSGEGVSIILVFISSFFILAPLSIFDGAQFPFGCRIWNEHTKKPLESTGSVYIFEAIGFIIAGPIFTYLFITRIHSFQIALIISFLNLLSALLLLQTKHKSFLRNTVLVTAAILFCINLFVLFSRIGDYLNSSSLKRQWAKYNLIDSQNSIYGNLAVSKQREQYTFFSDGIPIITTPVPDIVVNEEFIHFGMLSHPNPQDVLIVGGGAGGPISEILKYPVKNLDYAELDPLLIDIVKKYPTALTQKELASPRLCVKISDGARYIKTTNNKYDIIFINFPAPNSLQLNRFYTKELFTSIKNIFKDKYSLLVLRLPGSLTYLNEELQKLNLCILETLKDTFKFTKVIPGDFNLYLASKTNFNTDASTFILRMKKRKINTSSLTPFHIQYRLNKRWNKWFFAIITKTPPVKENTSLSPIGVFYALSYWNTLFSPSVNKFFKILEKISLKLIINITIFIFLIILFLSLVYPKLRKISVAYAIFSTGLLGMSFDLIIIFIYQSFYGYVYHHIALLMTAFMFGLTCGGWLVTKKLSYIRNKLLSFISYEFSLFVFCLAVIPVFLYLGKVKINLSWTFFVISIILGFLVGAEFPLANSFYRKEKSSQTAGILYAVDLLGSWVGALIISVALIPILGLVQTCIFLALLKISSICLIFIQNKN